MSSDCRPRYCFLEKSQIGYGFNLHGEEPRNNENVNELTTFYHVIKSVDEKSPACVGGLKQDDRLIGVNGFYVDTKPHNEVVRLIRSGGSSTWLLVVDRETDEYFFKVAKRKPTFSDAVYGQEDIRGRPVDTNTVPMEEEREEIRNGNFVVNESDDTDGHESQRSESAEVESPRSHPVPARRSRGEESDEEEEEEDTHKREEMHEHRSQEEEEAVNALVDAVNQHDLSREDQSHQSSNRASTQQSDNESESESARQSRGSYYHFQKEAEESDKEERADEPQEPSKPASVAPVNDDGSGDKKMMFLNMQSAREAARGKRNAAKTAGNWATKYEDFKRL